MHFSGKALTALCTLVDSVSVCQLLCRCRPLPCVPLPFFCPQLVRQDPAICRGWSTRNYSVPCRSLSPTVPSITFGIDRGGCDGVPPSLSSARYTANVSAATQQRSTHPVVSINELRIAPVRLSFLRLSPRMQRIAQSYWDARRRAGSARNPTFHQFPPNPPP